MKNDARLIHKKFNEINDVLYEQKLLNGGSALHFHDFYELELILSGSGQTLLNGEKFNLKKGCVVLTTPKDFHEYLNVDNLSIVNVQFNASDDGELNYNFSSPPITQLSDDDFSKITALLNILQNLLSGDVIDRSCASKILDAILLLVTSKFKRGATSDATKPKPIMSAIAYVQSHFKENPSLEEIAETVYFDKRYFCSEFKKHVGQTYKEYLREVKLQYALKLLKCTSLPVTDVAMESGYSTVSHFNREFKKFYGKSPTKVRKNRD